MVGRYFACLILACGNFDFFASKAGIENVRRNGEKDLDDPRVTSDRRASLKSKSLLTAIYNEWYGFIERHLPPGVNYGRVLELGSGPGFMQEVIPGIVTSEVLRVPFVDRMEDATALSYSDAELDALVMTDVLHHIPDLHTFFTEAQRVLRPGGRIICVEPWNTWWSRIIFRNFHHEPFVVGATSWKLPSGGPLSVANGALPWIAFERDRDLFDSNFPQLDVLTTDVFMPLSYLMSGGFSYPQLVPGPPLRRG